MVFSKQEQRKAEGRRGSMQGIAHIGLDLQQFARALNYLSVICWIVYHHRRDRVQMNKAHSV